MQRTAIVLSIVVALLALGCRANATTAPRGATAAASTAAAGPAKVVVAVGSAPSLFYLPYAVAKALHYYEDEGLDAEVQYLPGGAQAAAELLSGAAQFSGNSLDQAIRAQAQGKTLKMVVSFTRLPGLAVVVRGDLKDEIREIKDLKGRKIGVSAIGSDAHVLLQALVVKAGLKPADITVVPTGASTMAAAFDAKQIEAGVSADPFATQLLNGGRVALLADLRADADTTRLLGGEFQFSGALVSADLMRSRPEIVQPMVNALVRAETYILTHDDVELAQVLPNDVTGQDKQAWIVALKGTRPALSPDGRIAQTGVENALDAHRVFGTIGPRDRIDVQALYDNAFVLKALQDVK